MKAKEYFVYILKSQKDPERYYIGVTQNLKQRLKEHNAGIVGYSKRYIPWELETYIAFKSQKLAGLFEKYLKSGSGYAFLRKRLLEPC